MPLGESDCTALTPLPATALPLPRGELSAAFAVLDADGLGRVSFAEFEAWWNGAAGPTAAEADAIRDEYQSGPGRHGAPRTPAGERVVAGYFLG